MFGTEVPIQRQAHRDQKADKNRKQDAGRTALDVPECPQASDLNHREKMDGLVRDGPYVAVGGVAFSVHDPKSEPLEELISFHRSDTHIQKQPEEYRHRNSLQTAEKQERQSDQQMNEKA